MTKALYLFLLSLFVGANSWAASSFLKPTTFPKTSSDITFAKRIENAITGYQPYAGKSAYTTIQIESEEEYIARMLSSSERTRQQDISKMSQTEYCEKYPLDADVCPQTPTLFDEVAAIGNRQTTTTPSVPAPQTNTTPTKPDKPNANIIAQAQPTPTASTLSPTPTPSRPTGGATFGGQCTPPQRSSHFTNKILTTGKYANIDPAFEKAMITTFRTEGECSNDPDDSGGYTCYGISQKNNPEIDVSKITRADAEDIAYRKYYTQYNINKLPDNSRGNVFMLGWAGGPSTGIRKFCKFLGISERNTVDDSVVNAAANYSGDIHNDFLDAQQQFYIDVAKRNNNQKFLKGWMNRVRLMRENGCHSPATQPITR